MTYLATAYRFGWYNNHSYVVYCGNDYDRALELAEAEANDRGGKYGVDVRSYDDEGDWQMLLAYYPSSWGETKPYHNYRLDYFSRLGHMLDDYVRENPDHELVLKVNGQKEFYDTLSQMQKDREDGNTTT